MLHRAALTSTISYHKLPQAPIIYNSGLIIPPAFIHQVLSNNWGLSRKRPIRLSRNCRWSNWEPVCSVCRQRLKHHQRRFWRSSVALKMYRSDQWSRTERYIYGEIELMTWGAWGAWGRRERSSNSSISSKRRQQQPIVQCNANAVQSSWVQCSQVQSCQKVIWTVGVLDCWTVEPFNCWTV